MDNLKIATAQFEHKSGDKKYNLSVIEQLAKKASQEGTRVMAFHECSVTGYTFARNLMRQQLLDLAEYIPEGKASAISRNRRRHRYDPSGGCLKKTGTTNYTKLTSASRTGQAKYRKLHLLSILS